jgi:hemolysin activation/secretion protein
VAETGIPFSRFGADPTFEKVELHLVYGRALPAGFTGTLIGRAQHAFGNGLPDSEQFDLTGSAGLSAFLPGAIAGDSGYSLRAELARPFPFERASASGQVTPYVYGGVGRADLKFPSIFEEEVTEATSYGLGLRANVLANQGGTGATLALEFGRYHANGLDDDNRFSFSLGMTF